MQIFSLPLCMCGLKDSRLTFPREQWFESTVLPIICVLASSICIAWYFKNALKIKCVVLLFIPQFCVLLAYWIELSNWMHCTYIACRINKLMFLFLWINLKMFYNLQKHHKFFFLLKHGKTLLNDFVMTTYFYYYYCCCLKITIWFGQ